MGRVLSLPRLDRLMVTRPTTEVGRWVHTLTQAGWPAEALPLISIADPSAADDQSALAHARATWPQWDALMFVSSAAVNHFFAGAVTSAPAECHTRFWAPGPGTAKSLAAALSGWGLSADVIDSPPEDAAQFDSEALWPVVQGQMGLGKRLLVVRGASESSEAVSTNGPLLAGQGRDWLIGQCRALGAEVSACVAYERNSPHWSAALLAQAQAAAAPGSLWLFSSSEAVQHLRHGLPTASWALSAALVTHPRIAQSAQEAGFGQVQTTRPALPDVLRTLECHWSPI